MTTSRMVRAGTRTGVVMALLTLMAGAGFAGDLRLLDAVQRQDRGTIQTLLKQRVDVNEERADGITALAWAVHLDDLQTVDLLLRAGANPNTPNDLGVTPLMLAAVNGNASMADRLLKAKADPKVARSSGETALVVAARTGSAAVVKLLLGAGASGDFKIGAREQTPLMWAAAEGHAEVVKLLVEVGADKEARTVSKPVGAPFGHYLPLRKPLTRPDKTRSVITVLWPKDGDGDVERVEGGMTPLLLAIERGHQEAVKVLLEAGANIESASSNGITPLQLAMIRRYESLALYLIERGANPNNAGPGFPPLHVAGYLSQPAIAKALIAKGGDVNARLPKPYRLIEALELSVNLYPGSGLFTSIGATPFMTAARHGQVEIMRMLLAAGANPFLTARGGEDALMFAAGLGRPQPSNVSYHVWKESEQLEAVKLCLEVGLDINAQNQWGNTALHGAAYHDDARVIEYLASQGAWLDRADWQDQTPLRVAQGHEICCSTFHRKPAAAAALLKAGADPKAGVLLKFGAADYQDDSVKELVDKTKGNN